MAGTNFADTLNEANLALTLAVEIGGELVPLIKGIVSDVRQAESGNGQTVDFQLVLSVGQDQLNSAASSFQDTINKAQAELDRLNNNPGA